MLKHGAKVLRRHLLSPRTSLLTTSKRYSTTNDNKLNEKWWALPLTFVVSLLPSGFVYLQKKEELRSMKDMHAKDIELKDREISMHKKLAEYSDPSKLNAKCLKEARTHFKSKLITKGNAPKEDEIYSPYAKTLMLESLIEDSIRSVLTFKDGGSGGGVRVVFSPQDTGKSTRTMKVLQRMLKADEIQGYIKYVHRRLNQGETIRTHFYEFLTKATPGIGWTMLDMFDNMESDKPFVIVVDQLDKFRSDMQPFLEALADESTKSISQNNSVPFVVIALCSDRKSAFHIIAGNGGKKLKTLQDSGEGGAAPEDSESPDWKVNGLKLSNVESLVSEFEAKIWDASKSDPMKRKRLKGMSNGKLDQAIKAHFVKSATHAGSLGFIRDHMETICSTRSPSFDKIDDDAEDLHKQWKSIKGINSDARKLRSKISDMGGYHKFTGAPKGWLWWFNKDIPW